MDTVSGSNRLIIIHVGSEEGFLRGAQIYKANNENGGRSL